MPDRERHAAVLPPHSNNSPNREEWPDLVKRLYESGLTLARISETTNIPHESARVILHRAGVTMRHSHPTLGAPQKTLTSEGSLLLGLHSGDGWLSDTWGISLHCSDTKMMRFVFNLVKRVLAVEPFITTKAASTTIRSGKRQVREFFYRFGFTRGKKAGTVEVPREVTRARIEKS